MASTDLTRTHTTATANERKKHTFSAWIKLSSVGSDSNVIFANRPSNNYRFYYMIMNSGGGGNTVPNAFYTYMVYNGSEMLEASGTRKLRDTNGWYHIVVRTDTTQANAGDRFRVYINGEQDTVSLHHSPTQDEELQVNRDTTHYIGEEGNGNGQFNGSMSHIHFCDGYSYAPTEFGETDSTTGEWKIKTSPSVSYGTNGFFILKDGNSVTDQSGNSHNWTVNAGTLTKTEDCPSNVFCTNDVLGGNSGSITIGWGNSSAYRASSGFRTVTGNIGASAGKYYAECKINGTGTNGIMVGFVNLDTSNIQNSTQHLGEDSATAGIYNNAGQIYYGSASNFANTGAYSAGDIIQLAMDIDNGYLYFGKNGTWLNSSVPTSGSTGTGGLALSNLGSNGTYSFATSVRSGGDARWNFGNGYFEVTAITSEGTNASGLGKFEYDVPTGYTALCTKGLNE